jgi:cytochrome P450
MEEDDVMRKIAGDYWDGVKNYVLPESKIDGTGPAVKGKTGLFPAHKHLYFIMFQVSMRVVGSSEIIRDREKMQPMLDAYWDQENNASFINVFYNWLPIKSNKKRKEGGVNLYMGLRAPIDNRIAESRTEQDYVQRMIDFNVPVDDIVRWLIGALFASIINTSGMTTWTLIYASADPKIWKKMQAEIDSTIGRLSAARGMPDSASTHDKIAAITIEEWEAEFNFTYWCLRETMRLLSNDFALRKVANRHGGDGTELAGQKVKNAEFAGFYMESIHRDPSIYPDPSKYDPERWERGQGHGNMEFVGWGVGLHPCVGMKLAKNEIKMALAFFVSLMDMEPVDDKGNRYTAENLPTPKKMGQLRAPSKPLQLRYTMRGVR